MSVQINRANQLVLAAAVAVGMVSNLRANTVTSTWIGGTSTNWSNAANWSPNSANPNNGNNGVSDYNAIINSVTAPNFAPTLDVSVTIDILTLNTAAALALNSGITLNVNASTLNNAGIVTILGNGSFGVSLLNFNNIAALNGGGTLILTDSTFSSIGGANLTNVNDTIQGAGHLTSNITNQGTITAQGGTLTFDQNIDNSTGKLNVAANGTLSIGGTLTGSLSVAGGQILGSGTLSNVTLNSASAWNIQSGSNSPILFGTFTNKGTITLLGNGTLGVASLSLGAAITTLTGGGTIFMTNNTFSQISSGNLTNVNNTIQGAGTITSAVINQGTIIAQGGTLTFNNTVNNTAGNISVAANGTLSLGSTLTGSLSSVAGGQIIGSGTLSNVTLNTASAWNIQSGSNSPILSGTFTNKGTITLLGNGTLGVAGLTLGSGTTTLTGGGTIILTNNTFSQISTGNLTNVNNTIRGAGSVIPAVINQGTIIAEGGTLSFSSSVDNTAGNISVSANGTLSLSSTLTGSISTVAGAQITGSGTFSNATLNTSSAWTLPSGATSPTLSGTFTNKGTITLLGNGTLGVAGLTLGSGTTTLTGGGTIILTNNTFSQISTGNLTNVNNTIRGAGSVVSSVINQGSIIVEGGTMAFSSSVDTTAGTISVAANGTLSLNSTFTGALSTVAGAQIISSGSLSNSTLNTLSVWTLLSGTVSPALQGTFTNHGSINLLGNGTLGVAALTLGTGITTLNGGGTILMTNSTFSQIIAGNLTNVDNTIQGAGTIFSNLTNHGSIQAQAGTMSFNNDVDSSGGTIGVAANSSLSVNATLTGGTISSVASSQIIGSGILSNVTLNTGSVWTIFSGAASPTVTNTFTNKGTVTLLGNGTLGTSTLVLAPTGTTLNGGGNIILTNGTFSALSAGNLINVDNTIQGTGVITLDGGTFTNSGNYNFNGTLNSSDNVNNSGNFTQSGLQSWSENTTFTNSGNATFNSDTGSFSLINLNNTAGLLRLNTPQNINSLTIIGGNVTLPTTGNLRQDFGVVLKSSSLSIAPTSTLDITNHDLIIGNTTLQLINDEILNGFNAGPGGAQITSSTALSDGNKFLIPLDAAALGIPSWDNVNITDPNSIIIKYTYFGDANLDGLVDGNDFSVIAGNFQNTTPGIADIEQSWLMGDVNLDGVVDGNDFSVVAGNFGSVLLIAPASTPITPTNVPEPASLSALLLSLPFLPKNRRYIKVKTL